MGHQTKLSVWPAGTEVMNDKYHGPAALSAAQGLFRVVERTKNVVFTSGPT